MVGKFASADDQSRGTGLALRAAYEIEVRFYREVASRLSARVPASYVALVEPPTGWFTLLLEDIVGGRQGDQIEACGADVAASVLEEMAGLHAPCWEAGDLAGLEWLNRATPEYDAMLGVLVTSLLPGFLERYEDCWPRPIAMSVSGSSRRSRPGSSSARDRARPATATSASTTFCSSPTTPVRSWSTGRRWRGAGASVDVAYFIGGCLDAAERRMHEEDLVAHYHAALCRRGVQGYPLEQLRADTRRDTFGGLLMAIVASMVVQRTERGDLMFLTSTTRHAQHVLDADALALLDDAR